MSVTHKFSIGNYDKDYYDNKDNYDNVVIGWRELMRLGPREDGATVYGLTLTGNGLRDYFEGDNGYDTFWGGGGDDMLQTGSGDDTLHGGDGNDLVDGARGDDYLYGDAGDDIMDGGAGDDFLYGGVGNDRMDGGADDDYLYGGDGDDMLQGSPGDDYLYGGDGDDTMDGGWGDGYLYGGAGDDTLSGGPGSDKFMYPTRSFGKDVITDFDVREDKIDFRGSGLGFSDLKLGWSSPDTVLVEAGAGNRIELVALTHLYLRQAKLGDGGRHVDGKT